MERGEIDKAKATLAEGISLIKHRIKLIRIADKSEFGWETVNEYVADEVTLDSEDNKKTPFGTARGEEKREAEEKVTQPSRPDGNKCGTSANPNPFDQLPSLQISYRPLFHVRQIRASPVPSASSGWAGHCRNTRHPSHRADMGACPPQPDKSLFDCVSHRDFEYEPGLPVTGVEGRLFKCKELWLTKL